MRYLHAALATMMPALCLPSMAFSAEFTIAADVTPANSDTVNPGRPAIAFEGTNYLVVSCRELGTSPGAGRARVAR